MNRDNNAVFSSHSALKLSEKKEVSIGAASEQTLKNEVGNLFQKFLNNNSSTGLNFSYAVPAAALTTFSLGGPVEILVDVRDLKSLQSLIITLNKVNLPWRTIGAGSNIVINDSGLSEIIIRLGREFISCVPCQDLPQDLSSLEVLMNGKTSQLLNMSSTKEKFLCFGAASLMGLSRRTAAQGLSGLEFAAGIPASIGGALAMNAGAHGHAIAEVLEKVYLLDRHGELYILNVAELEFSYRHSAITKEMIVIAALISLDYGDPANIKRNRAQCLAYRKETQPLHLPSAGSVFRNPDHIAAAQLIETVGLKGREIDGVRFSELHANWLVKSKESAKAGGVKKLVEIAIEQVKERFDLVLETEVKLW